MCDYGVAVAVGSTVAVLVAVAAGVSDAVTVAVSVAAVVAVLVAVAALVAEAVAVLVGVAAVVAVVVLVATAVLVTVAVPVAVAVLVAVAVPVLVAVAVAVLVGSTVGVWNWPGVGGRVEVGNPEVLVGTAVNVPGGKASVATAVLLGVGETTTGSVGGSSETGASGAMTSKMIPAM